MVAGRNPTPRDATPAETAVAAEPAQAANSSGRREQEAILLAQQGKLSEAESIYRRLISDGQMTAKTACNLAVICGQTNRLAEAVSLLRRSIELKEDSFDAHANLGVALKRSGDRDGAIAAYRRAVQLNAEGVNAHLNLARALQEAGDRENALASYQQVLNLRPDHALAHYKTGLCLQELGRNEEAIHAYQQASRLGFNRAELHTNLGTVQLQQGDIEASIASHRRALRLDDTKPEIHINLGSALQASGDVAAAIQAHRHALTINPNLAEAHYNLGVSLQESDDLKAAGASYRKAIELKPDFLLAYLNLGICLEEDGEIQEAMECFNKAHAISPESADACWNRAACQLLTGDYEQGWHDYECRSRLSRLPCLPHANPRALRWDGRELSPEEQLLVVSEQSLSDTMHFMRYVLALRERGLKVRLAAPGKLHRLIQTSGIDPQPLSEEQANEVEEGYWIPLISIPGLLNVSPCNPIITAPHLRTTVELEQKWRTLLAAEQTPIIAINWQGDPNHEHGLSRGRSLPLQAFAPLAEQTDLTLLSLQKGWGSEQLESCSFRHRFVRCQEAVDQAWDFLETAAVIANCDLVITTDTAVAQLAGGMGRTTWLLLKQVPDWRWGLESERSFWYPEMRLFRQRRRGDWAEVIARVCRELRARYAGTGPSAQTQIQLPPELGSATVLAPTGLGELMERIAALEIRCQHLQGTERRGAEQQLLALRRSLGLHHLKVDARLMDRLLEIHADLWQLKAALREQEHRQTFGELFIRLARSIQEQKQRRASLRAEIDLAHAAAALTGDSAQP